MGDRFDTQGDFGWCELLTRDTEGAKAFYAELLGWEMVDQPMEEDTYTVLRAGGRPVGGIMQMPSCAPPETPPHWGTYVTVDDVDAVAKKVVELGGQVLFGPHDIPEVGRFCVFQDPQGAVLSVASYTTKPE